MKMIRSLIAAASIAVLAGCASHPDRIAASHVSHERFAGASCASIDQQLTRAMTNLEAVSSKQRSSMVLDAVTVFFVLVPASALAGDHQADVAAAKGEVEALKTARARCESAPVQPRLQPVAQPVAQPDPQIRRTTNSRVGPNTLRCVTQPNGTTLVCD